ncbi:MAG: hypothetical protein M3P40_08040 [Actinomycetota bacterium]|nr:hypothetical protein [Actinomycetota bacterium]
MATAAEHQLVAAGDVRLDALVSAGEVNSQWRAGAVGAVCGSNGVIWKEAEVLPKVEVAVADVSVGELDPDLSVRACRCGVDPVLRTLPGLRC